MAARCTDTIVYRSLPVNGDQLRALKLGQSIKSKNPQATASIRDHVLLGSKADFRSQFISTTGSLDIALKYAVPVHTVIAINLAKYQASCGKVYDLSTEECFAQQVTPIKSDISTAADVWRRMDEDFGAEEHDLFRQEMYSKAALTKWECCRLFSVRSCEVLLEGDIPFDCVSVVKYTTRVQSVTSLPHQPHKIPFESFETSVATGETRYADGDNGGLLDLTLRTDSNNHYLLKQARRNSLESGVLSARELRSSIDLEFAAFDTYRRVAHYVPGVDIAVRDCVKIMFRYELLDSSGSADLENDPVLNCLLFRCIKQPNNLLPVEKIIVPLFAVEESGRNLYGNDFKIPDKPQANTLQVMQKGAKQAGDEFTSEMSTWCEQFGDDRHYIRHHFKAEDCTQLFKGLAVDLLIGNVYAGGSYEKAGIAKSRTGNLYRLSADRALGNQLAESLNADRRDDHAGCILMESVSVEAKWERIPMHTLCCALKTKLYAIKKAVEDNKEDFYSDAYKHLDLPYDVKRSLILYPSLNRNAARYDEEFTRFSTTTIWEDYLLNRCMYLCYTIDLLEEKSRNADMEGTADVLEALHKLFNFVLSHRPFKRVMPRAL